MKNRYMMFLPSMIVFFSVLTVQVYASGGSERPTDPEIFPTDEPIIKSTFDE